ncbi:hypothetical protein BRARA_C00544, partial [Brassica rapa]
MNHRYTTEEKGKAVAHRFDPKEAQLPRRIRAPEIDTSALVKENLLTLIGRVLNPKEQPIGAIISALPRKWNIKGAVNGSDLGQNCFQFRFELEEDLHMVLAGRPYHYNHWMLVLQKWEPIISSSFPSQIPFWIRLQGIPLHFWHKAMIDTISQELGELVDHKITKSSARILVLVDALQPLVKDSIIDFATGEELPITLEYENLEYHCSVCSRLSHVARNCPKLSHPRRHSPPKSRGSQPSVFSPPENSIETTQYPRRQAAAPDFSKRLDRHGRPFGERVALPPARGRPISNKIVPRTEDTNHFERPTSNQRPLRERHQENQGPARNTTRRSDTPVWREKIPPTNIHLEENMEYLRAASPIERPPLERNLALCDFPPAQGVPTREEVMNDLRE